jgi:ssDNA-binding Zn-finger/Zn-ribbon topoisomerase 1
MYTSTRSKETQSSVITCPVCGSDTVKRTGRFGSFWGCSRYPGCHGTQPFKIDYAGQPCRHCRTPVVRQTHAKPPKPRPGGSYFERWFRCPGCKAVYLVEAARRFFDATDTTLWSTALFSPDDRVRFCAKPPGTVRLAAERETSQARL